MNKVFLFLILALPALAFSQPTGTVEDFDIRATLSELARSQDPQQNAFLNDLRVKELKQVIDKKKYPKGEEFTFQFQYGLELHRNGQFSESIEIFKQLEKSVDGLKGKASDEIVREISTQINRIQAVNNLRAGMGDLGPIAVGMDLPNNSNIKEAKRYLEAYLKEKSRDPQALWLLNLMDGFKGSKSSSIKGAEQIDLTKFAADNPIKPFENASKNSGITNSSVAGDICVEDFNEDGLPDVMTCSFGLNDQIRLYLNQGDGKFKDVTESSNLKGITGGLRLRQADYNNDGNMDVYVVRGGWLGQAGKQPNSLLKNNGDGTFTDVTGPAGLVQYRPSSSATWVDVNKDGKLDLFVANEFVEGYDTAYCELYYNNGNETFYPVAKDLGLKIAANVKDAIWGDINNDGWQDMFVSIHGGKNLLYLSKGQEFGGKVYKEIAGEAGVDEPIYSLTAKFVDYDNDGALDILLGSWPQITENYGTLEVGSDYLSKNPKRNQVSLFRNNGSGKFTEVSSDKNLERSIFGLDYAFGDVDNDGYLDLYAPTSGIAYNSLYPNLLFRNNAGKNFEDITLSSGTGHFEKSNTAVLTDFNNDGQTDIMVATGGFFSGDKQINQLLLNPGGTDSKWIKLKLDGNVTQKSMIGARIKVLITKATGREEIHRVITGDGEPLMVHIGLGNAQRIDKIDIVSPSTGQTTTLKDVGMNKVYKVFEDTGKQAEWKIK